MAKHIQNLGKTGPAKAGLVKNARAVTLAAMVLVTLAGCGSMQLLGPSVDESGAKALMDDGQFRDAAMAYQRLARKNSEQRARYQLLSADAWREEGDYNSVQTSLKAINRSGLTKNQSVQFDLLDAEILLSRGDAEGALNLLVADPQKLPPELAAGYFELRAQAFEKNAAYADAALERAALNSLLDPVERAANEHDLRALLDKLDTDARRNLMRSTARTHPLFPFLAALGGAAREGGASSYTDSVTAAPAASRTRSLSGATRENISRIALLLPSSGPIAPAARAVQDGIFAAYFSDTSDNRPELALIDSGLTAASGKAAYDKAIADGFDHVIGPLQRDQVTAIFQSNDAILPTLALNFADSPTLPPKGSLQFALLPEEEAVAAADHMAEKGLKRVAVLVPDDEFGRRAAEAFEARFTALGGEIGERAFFSITGTDNSAAILSAMGVTESQARAQLVRGIVGIPFSAQASRRYDLEGIFLAAKPPQGRLLLPQLRAFDADDWPIVATSNIYAGSPDAELDRDLNGLEFCDAPWLLNANIGDDVPPRESIRSLNSTVGAGARLVAFGIDAYRTLTHLSWLENNPDTAIAGATGLLSVDQNGSVRRKPSWAVMRVGVPVVTGTTDISSSPNIEQN